ARLPAAGPGGPAPPPRAHLPGRCARSERPQRPGPLSARQLGRARDLGHVRDPLSRPSRPDPDPDARRLGRPPAPTRLPGRWRAGRLFLGSRAVADQPSPGVGVRSPLDGEGQGGGLTLAQTPAGADDSQILTVNFGPHHPSTHGVLRLIVDLDGEVIRKVTPVIGYLHTGIEKTAESLRYQQVVTVTDRHDYLSPLFNNHSYAMAVERLMGVEV